MDKIVTKKNLNYTVGKIKGLLNEKQNNITSENKLSKDLVSGLGTASSVDTGTSSGNVPVLGTDGKLPSSVVPASAITDTFVASSQSAMLGLSNANIGDVCVRTDINKSFILKATPYSTLSNWQELLTPTDAVTSVNGQTGAVQLPEAGNGTLTIQRNGMQLGTFKANQTTGTTIDIEVPTVGAAASKGVVTTVDTSANLPTSNAVKTFVEGKGYVTSSGSVASATNATKLNNQDASYYLDYSNFENVPKIPDKISELTEDTTHRTVTDTEKSNWNAKSNFSGNYNDLSNKPTIPTVNNGTLTIQKNGASVGTFTANQSGNSTINIEAIDENDKAYKFAESEYNKSLNKFDEIVTRGNIDNTNGNFYYSATGNNLLSVNYMPMKPSTVYSYKTSKSGMWIYEYDANKTFLGLIDIVSGSSFTSKSNTAYYRVAFWGGYGTTYLNDAIVKEGTNPVYSPYKGETVWTGDITPVLLWENASPNSTFGETYITNQNIPNYKYLTIIYRQVWTSEGCAVAKFALNYGSEYCLNVINYGTNNQNSYARPFYQENSTTLHFKDCYDKDKYTDNYKLIPLKMYLSNY